MLPFLPRCRAALLLFAGGLGLGFSAGAAAPEFRALWVDAFNPGFKTAAQVRQLVADARRGNFNALVVQMRRRGDAFFNSALEPRAAELAAGFDPLAELLREARDTNGGPRLEVHAWIVTYNIWNQQNTLPPQANHPYRLHPDWLTESHAGQRWGDGNYAFDPAHPAVQEHTVRVALDLVTRHDVDGFHWDYVRYNGREWGYNPVAVQRFQRRSGRTDRPAPADAAWLQFRRDEITALVRRTYLELLARRPALKISAATITFAPGITTTAQWPTSAAYSEVLQDWRAWLEEGLLDLNVPMAYFDQRQYAPAWANWSLFAKDHAYGRHLALGGALYLNTISNSLGQIRSTRTATPAGARAQGFAGYSYANMADGATRAQMLDALTLATPANPDPPFAEVAPVPVMPWKSTPTLGHLLGHLRDAAAGGGLENVPVTLCGPAVRTVRTDANGVFGAVKLPPGVYAVTAAIGDRTATNVFHVQPGFVATNLLVLPAALPPEAPREVRVSAGADAAVVSFTTAAETPARLELGVSPCALATFRELPPATRHSAWLGDLPPAQPLFLRVVTTALDGEEHAGATHEFSPAGSRIVDNRDASLAGPWSLGTSASGKHGPDYAFAGTAATVTATAVWAVGALTPGRYDVRLIFPPGGNRSARAPFELVTPAGTNLVLVDQTAVGGVAAWTDVALPADGAFVRLRNNTGESGRVVLADAVEFRYRAEQDALDPANPPAWWTQHFFPGTSPSPAADADGDGLANGEEFVAGTDPTDPLSQPWLRLAPGPPGGVALTAGPAVAGRRYFALRQATLPGDPVRLGPLAGDALSGEASLVDTAAPPAAGFYQLEISPSAR